MVHAPDFLEVVQMVKQMAGGAGARLALALASAYWRDEDARAVLGAWASSGQSMGAFAREHGLQRARLHRWKQRLMPNAFAEAPALFWPVEVAPVAERHLDTEAWTVELTGGISIIVPCGGGADLLAETLAAIRSGWSC